MNRYIIVRRPAGRVHDGATRGAVVEVTAVAVENLSSKDAAEAARDPSTEEIAPAMPTWLIEPASESEVGEVAGGNWGIRAVGADRTGYSGAGVSVAVLDTGIDLEHAAFQGMHVVAKDFSGDGEQDVRGHGTHCAGILFGRDVKGSRIGVARGITKAFVGKVLRNDGRGDTGMLIEALIWAARQKVDIVSMSLGFDFPGLIAKRIRDGWPEELAVSDGLVAYRANLRVFDAIMGLINAQGGSDRAPLIVAAAGNQSRRSERPDYRIGLSLPAAAADVISVGAVGMQGDRYRVAPFSNAGPIVCAPGVDIVSSSPGGKLHSASGTSMACPLVAGVAALWLEKMRKSGRRMDATGLAARLRASADTNALEEGFDATDIGEGIVAAPSD